MNDALWPDIVDPLLSNLPYPSLSVAPFQPQHPPSFTMACRQNPSSIVCPIVDAILSLIRGAIHRGDKISPETKATI